MTRFSVAARSGAAGLMVAALAACSSMGSLGNVLGSVLGGGGTQGNQLQGTVLGVDTRSQYISVQDPNGQSVSLGFDNQTKVVFQNQTYPVTSLERGDRITATVQQTSNGAYYTDYVQVDQSVSGTATGSASGNVQQIAGIVRQVDYNNGWFTLDVGNNRYTVTMPYNPSTNDANIFRSLRAGQNTRLYGVYLNNSRIELRQFY